MSQPEADDQTHWSVRCPTPKLNSLTNCRVELALLYILGEQEMLQNDVYKVKSAVCLDTLYVQNVLL